jgi:hypothetical protein
MNAADALIQSETSGKKLLLLLLSFIFFIYTQRKAGIINQ